MLLLPYENFTIQTHLAPDQVREKLSGETDPAAWSWSAPYARKTYRGQIQENKFEITRITYSRNSFQPVIKGNVFLEMGITHIKVTMMPDYSVTIFMILWLGFIGFIFIMLLASWIFSFGTFYVHPQMALLYVGSFFLFSYAIFISGFKFESIKSARMLRVLLETYQEQNKAI